MKKNNTIAIEGILSTLPHRQPFALVDRILEIHDPGGPTKVGRRVRALKNVTYNEPFFAGHFPNRPIMPGVIIMEVMAQAAAMACARDGDPKLDIVVAKFSEVRFHRPVVPGDQLITEAEVVKQREKFFYNKVRSTVDGELVAEFEILASVSFPKSGETSQHLSMDRN